MSGYASTLLTAELALKHGLACNTAGGTHHAYPSFGSGFCILNDLAVTSEVLLHRKAVDRILILDLDVHQVRHFSVGMYTVMVNDLAVVSEVLLHSTAVDRILILHLVVLPGETDLNLNRKIEQFPCAALFHIHCQTVRSH